MLPSNTWDLLLTSTQDTLWMTAVSGIVGAALGIPIGILLYVTDKKGFIPLPWFNALLGLVVNILRSVPFIILLFAITPFTRFLVGTGVGTNAAIVPLTVSVAPFIARIVETSLREVDKGLIEAAQSMGASTLQIIRKVLLPEAMPGITAGLTISLIALVSYSAMAGAVGGGGLGDLAIRYGYQRNIIEMTWIVVALLVIMVQIIQSVGDALVRRLTHK